MLSPSQAATAPMPAPSLLLLAALLRAPTSSEPSSAGDPSQEPLPLRVDWTAEPSCPDAEALRVELVRLLHRELRFDPDAEARVEAVIRRHPREFVLELSVFAGSLHEQRTLRAERCEEFRTAAALVVALALEPWAAGIAPPAVPEPETVPVEAPPEAPGEPAPVPDRVPMARASEPDYDASLGLVCTAADCRLAYPIRDDIPVMLIDEAERWRE